MSILFDLDGTIIGTRREKGEIRKECARELGIPEISDERYYESFKRVVHGSKLDTRVPIFEDILGDRDLAKEFARIYGKRGLENTFLYPDAEEVLEKLPTKKGLVTNGPRLVQREKIEKFNLQEYFDVILISGEVGKSKPGREIFYSALESLESRPDESLYVGNVPDLDVVGAKNAGLTSVLICREGDPTGPEPHYVIRDLRELYDIVDEMENSG